MSTTLLETSDAPPPTTSLKEVAGDVSRIVQNYIMSLAEKDEIIFKLHQEKLELEGEVEKNKKEKDQLSQELNEAVDALERLDNGTKDLQEKFLGQVSIMNVVETEIAQLSKACGFSVSTSSRGRGSHNDSLVEDENKEIVSLKYNGVRSDQEKDEKRLSTSLSSSFPTPSALLSLRRSKEFVQALRHDFTLMEVEVDRFALSSQVSWQMAYEYLMDAEYHARQLLMDEGLHSIPLRFAAHGMLRLVDLYSSLESYMTSSFLAREDEKKLEEERLSAEEQRHARDCKKYTQQIEEMKADIESCRVALEKQNSAHTHYSKSTLLWSSFLESRLVISQQRSDAVERLWRQSMHQLLKRFSFLERQWKETIKDVETENQQFQDTIKRQSSILLKQERLAATYAKNMEASTGKIEELNKVLETHKAKCIQLQAEREEQRKRKEDTLQDYKTKNISLSRVISQQKAEILQMKEGEDKLSRENQDLQSRVRELTAMIDKLQPVAAKGEVFPELLQAAEQRTAMLMEQLTSQQAQKAKELAEAMKTIEALKISKMNAVEAAEKFLKELQKDKEQREKIMATMASEIETLQQTVHSLGLEKEEATKRLWMEQEARCIFERQQSMEVDVIKKLVRRAEKAETSASALLNHQAERDDLVRKVSLLEDACRKSANMIAELREMVCAERQLSAQLLSSVAFASPVSVKP